MSGVSYQDAFQGIWRLLLVEVCFLYEPEGNFPFYGEAYMYEHIFIGSQNVVKYIF